MITIAYGAAQRCRLPIEVQHYLVRNLLQPMAALEASQHIF